FSPCFDWRDEGAREVIKLVLPVMASLSVTYINSTILPRSFSSVLPHGAATSVEMANRVIQLPVALFGASIGIALFPTLSILAAAEALDELRNQIVAGMRAVLLFALPSAMLIGVLREQIIALLFQYGRWTAYDTQATSVALLFYSIGVPAMSCQYILVRGFYAMRDTKTPVAIAICSFLLALTMNFLLVRTQLEHGGLALASSVAAWFNMVMLALLLHKRLHGIVKVETICVFMWLVIGTALMGVLAHACLHIIPAWMSANLYGRFVCVLAPSLVGMLAFIFILWTAKINEVELLIRRVATLLRFR
ncbi:MAG: MATE family efflux transporter, partial [Armatimonadetes bacterium]|nr:MATE family efflux transporter [Armatimonadota bacterium]